MMEKNISVITEIPEDLHQSLKGYLDQNPTWDQDRVITAALAKFLLNEDNGLKLSSNEDWKCIRVYLQSNFQ